MSVDILVVTVEATHQSLQQRLDEVVRSLVRGAPAREGYARADAFMAAASRHLAGVEEVLVPLASHRLEDGTALARTYLDAARHLEAEMARLKGRLYGEQHVAHLPLKEVWTAVCRSLGRHNEAERHLVDRLAAVLGPGEAQDVAMRVYRAELKAPTRAHPGLPHTGRKAVVARRIWAAADRFWDATQNRTAPPPVRPRSKHHEHESLMSQFLTGALTLDPQAPVVHHREGRAQSRR